MSSIINFLLEANLSLLVFAAFYWLFLHRETDFRAKRYFIILAVAISIAAPLVDLSNSNTMYKSVVGDIPTIILPALEFGGAQEQEIQSAPLAWFRWVFVGYMLVSFILLVLFANQLYRLLQIIKMKRAEHRDAYTMVYTDGQFPTFSFFRWLFFDDSVVLSDQERAKIIAHEEVHIRQGHSFDIVLMETMRILCWINPASWWLRRELQETHEYLADEHLLRTTHNDEYSSLLAKMALQKLSISLGNHFNKSLTIKRIRMMKTEKSKMRAWKAAAAFSVIVTVFVAFSCNENLVQEMNEVLSTSTMATMPEEFKPELKKLQAKYPTAKFNYMESDMDNEGSLSTFKSVDPATIGFLKIMEDENGEKRIGMLVNSLGKINEIQTLTFEAKGNDNHDEVFTVVEDQPEPPNGMKEFYMYIAKNLKYPVEARRAGVEGKVFIQFIVNEDGSLSDVTAVKGIGHGCDEEAISVVAASDKWNPGKQRGRAVKVRMILPITFKLGGGANEDKKEMGDATPNPENSLLDVIVVGYTSR